MSLRRATLPAALLCLALPVTAAEIDVHVEGVGGGVRENVLQTLSVQRYRDLPELTETMVRRLHARARNEIRQALRPFGYYEPEIDTSLEYADGTWTARYRITPGDPVRIRDVDIRVTGPGRDDPAFALPADVPRRGDRLRHTDYEQAKQHFLTVASNRGYLDGQFTASELRVSVIERAADVRLHFDTRERYHFGPIALEQDILDDDFVRRFVQFEEGDPFSLGQLLSLQYALTDSEYFSLVEIDARRDHAVDRAIPVTVQMSERAKHRYTAGVGYATDTGPRITAGWENRRINRRGHRLLTDLELSEVRQAASTRYVVPLDNPAFERLTYAAGVWSEEFGDVQSDRAELVVAHSTRHGRWQQTLTGRLSRERDEVGDVTTLVTQFVPGGDWLHVRGDTGPRPRRTRRLYLAVAASDPLLGAPTEFVQVRTRGRFVVPVGARDRLLLRAEVGATAAGNPDDMTAAYRFFAGGDQSVRGYRYQALGPQDQDGNVIGGPYLATFSVEYEHWVTDSWGVGVFVDTGNAFKTLSDGFNTGAGIGLRWGLPFLVISLDLAHPFDDPDGRTVRVHLTFGGEL